MAKDPAMLWYWSDWHSGTALMTRFLKGCYMDLLHAQFNHGRLSLDEVKICLGSDFGTAWPSLQKKFKQDSNQLFFNERLEREQLKRQKFTESRRNNLKSNHKEPHMDNHMGKHMENRNRNVNDNELFIMVSGEKILDPLPLLEFYEVQLNGMVKENYNVAWKPLVPKWFEQRTGEDFKDANHAKNSFKRFYLDNNQKKPKAKNGSVSIDLEGVSKLLKQ